MFKLVIGAVFRNEADNMIEFIEHYLFHGVEHFYFINDGSTDNYMEILQPYIEQGLLTLFHGSEPRTVGRQERVYNTMFLPHVHESQWWLIADLDEFLYAPEEIDLRNILDRYTHRSQVSAEWLMFGSDGTEQQPELLVPHFRKRCPHGISYKSFVQTQYLHEFSIHRHVLVPDAPAEELLKIDASGNAPLIMNHYRQQSLERWMKRVSPRGDGSITRPQFGTTYPLEVFFEHNYNDIEDNRLLIQNAPILEKIRDLKNKYTYI